MITNSIKLLLDFNAICELSDTLGVLPCASPALHCLLLLCLAFSSLQLSCLDLQNQFFQWLAHILTLLIHLAPWQGAEGWYSCYTCGTILDCICGL